MQCIDFTLCVVFQLRLEGFYTTLIHKATADDELLTTQVLLQLPENHVYILLLKYAKVNISIEHLTIICRRRGDYREIFT